MVEALGDSAKSVKSSLTNMQPTMVVKEMSGSVQGIFVALQADVSRFIYRYRLATSTRHDAGLRGENNAKV